MDFRSYGFRPTASELDSQAVGSGRLTEKTSSKIGRAHPIDLHVGTRVRGRRKAIGMSQGELAAGVGLTFQQIQKYERGQNRISASKLYEIAKVVQVPISWFFEGPISAPGHGSPLAANDVHGFLATGVSAAYAGIKSDERRRRVLDLMRAMAADL